MANTRKAKIRATGQVVQVYKLERGTWCNCVDCRTEYEEEDLEFLS